MSDNAPYIENDNAIKRQPKKKRIIVKFLAAILILCIGALIALPLIFSDDRIINTIETAFQEKTGLKLEISAIDLKLYSGHILVTGVKSTTSSGKIIATIEEATLKLSIYDIYNLYKSNSIHIKSLEIIKLHLTKVPYLDLIKDINSDSPADEDDIKVAELLDTMSVAISRLYLQQEQADIISYILEGNFKGMFSGGGEIEGRIMGLKSPKSRDVRLTASTTNFQFNFNSDDDIIANTYTGSLELERKICNFDGNLVSQFSPLNILDAIPETHYKGAGSWNLSENIITIPDLLITNPEGLMIKASGYIKDPTNSDNFIISADISDSLAQLHNLNFPGMDILLSMHKGFNFIGKVYISPEKIDIKGRAAAENVQLIRDKAHLLSSKISTDFSATNDSLLFENIDTRVNNTELTGSIFIPTDIFEKELQSISDFTALELNINLQAEMDEIAHDLQTLGCYPENGFIPQGEISCKLVATPTNNTQNDFKISIGSNDKNSSILNASQRKLLLGRFAGNLMGKISDNGKIQIEQLSFKSKPLELSVEANNYASPAIINTSYALNFDLESFSPFLPYNLSSALSAIKSLQLSGKAAYDLSKEIFTASENKTEMHLFSSNTPSYITFAGPFTIETSKKWQLSLPRVNVNVINSDIINSKQSVGCSAVLKSEINFFRQSSQSTFDFSPNGVITIGARSKDSTLINLLLKLGDHKSRPFSSGSSTLRAKLNFTDEKIDGIAKLSAKDFIVTNPVYFSDTTLIGDTSFSYKIPDNKITINQIKFTDAQKSYEYTGTGNIYLENEIIERFNSKLTADLDAYLRHFKGYGEDIKYEGKIEVFSEIIGTSNAPSLTLVGKSDKITVTKDGFTNITSEPKFDAQISWNRDLDGNIYGLKAEEVFLKSSNGAIYLSGVSEKFKFEDGGVVDFGKGCNIDISAKGNRGFIWMIFPEYNHTSNNKGNADSITLSANITASKMPLFSFERDMKLRYINQITVNNGKFNIDEIEHAGIRVKDISGDFSLKDSIAKLTNGKADLSGAVTFSSITKISETPEGKILLTLSQIDLAHALSRVPSESPVINGWLNLPSNSPDSSLELYWKGRTGNEIIESLSTKREKASIKDLVIESVNERQDWEKYLSVDFPPVLANEIAKSIDQKLAPTYGLKKKSHYKYFDADYNLGKGAIRINSIKCGGGNTADLLITGLISLSGKIKLRIFIVDNLNKTFDATKLINIPAVQGLTANLSPEDKRAFYNILPSTLDRLAKEKKLFLDVTGTIDKPDINIDNISKEMHKSLPAMIKQANSLLGQNGLLQLLLKDVKSEKLRNALGANGDESSLKSGSSIGDLIQLIE